MDYLESLTTADYLESLTTADYLAADTDAHRNFIAKLLRLQTYDDVPLLLGAKTRPFENWESTLFHAAKNNGLASITPLLRALALPERGALNPKRHTQLSRSFHADIDSLAAAIPTKPSDLRPKDTVLYGGHHVRRDQLALSTSRMCPVCVAETGYGRSWWALAPQAVCDIHGIALIDHCPECYSPISIARPGYCTCHCGANLSTAKPPIASVGARRISQLIAARFKYQAAPRDVHALGFPERHLDILDLGLTLDLITFLGTLHSNQKVARMRKLKGAVSLSLALTGLERASRALTDWPNGFYCELRRARAFFPHSESLSAVAKSLDHVVQLATISMPQPELRFLADEIGRFLANPVEWNGARKHFALQKGGY